MATTVKTLYQELLREYSLGRSGTTTGAGSTTTIVDASRFGGPFAGNEWERAAPIRILSRAAVVGGVISPGRNSFVSDFDPSTGTFTVLSANAFDDTPEVGTDFVVFFPGVCDHSDRVLEAANRFLTRVARRWDKVPLTAGGLGAALLASSPSAAWTASNSTLDYLAGSSADMQWFRYLEVTATGTNGYARSEVMGAAPDEVWDFYVPAVQPYASAVAQVIIYDETNATAITPTYLAGSASLTRDTPQDVRGYFEIPTGCERFSVRYNVTVSGRAAAFGPLFVAKRGQTQFAVPVELESQNQLGRLFTISGLGGTTSATGSYEDRFLEVDYGYTVAQRGFAQVLQFDTPPPFPLLIDANIPYPALTAGDPTSAASGSAASESDSTDCPRALLLAGAAVEFFKWAQREERRGRGPDNHATRWDGPLLDAEAALVTAQGDWNAPKMPSVRKHFSGRAYA